MKKKLLILPMAVYAAVTTFAQTTYEFDFRHNDPNDVAQLLILAETGIDGSVGSMGFSADLNIGAIARYSLNDKIDLQTKIRKSYATFHFDKAYRKNFEIELTGAVFVKDETKLNNEEVLISGKTEQFGAYVYTESKYFNTDLPQRNAFGFNATVNYKTLGVNPKEGNDHRSNEGYKGARDNVNFSTLSLIGGLQFKRINASVVQVKRPRVNRIFDNYTVMTIDGIFAPVNTFKDAITGESVGKELESDGLKKAFPFGGRITYNVYGSIPSHKLAKSFRYTISSSIGYRPYLGFHFDFGIGFMVLRSM